MLNDYISCTCTVPVSLISGQLLGILYENVKLNELYATAPVSQLINCQTLVCMLPEEVIQDHVITHLSLRIVCGQFSDSSLLASQASGISILIISNCSIVQEDAMYMPLRWK